MASMKCLVLSLPLFLASYAVAWADEGVCLPARMSLDDETRFEKRDSQDVELDRQRPDDSSRLTPMEFVYRHSQFEAGALYTDFAHPLGLRSHLGYYVRYGVEIAPHLSVNMTYRYNAFGAGSGSAEDVVVQNLVFGASYEVPLTREFAAVGGLGIGPAWFDSNMVKNELGFAITAEIGVTAHLGEMLRFKTGIVLDGVNTTFHKASGVSADLSFLFGLEIGM